MVELLRSRYEIIKEGVAPSKKTAEMTCSNCGCIFEAAKEEFAYQADQRGDDFWVIICPTDSCNKTLFKYYWSQV